MKILFISSEVSPFAKTGGLGDVSWALPSALNETKHKCSIIMPFYRHVRKHGFKPEVLESDIKIQLGRREYSYNLLHLKRGNTDVYFIDNPGFYDREYLYNSPKGDYPDNPFRFAFFARAVLSAVTYIGPQDILHCNDWQSGLIPLYLKLFYKDRAKLKRVKTLFTIHNVAYQGSFNRAFMPRLDLPAELGGSERKEFRRKLNFMKVGVIYSDAVSTVSKGYAREIMTKEFGFRLERLLRKRRLSFYGVTNGADYNEWNPKIDKLIAKNYDAKNLKNKIECKKDLLEEFGLAFDEKRPVLGMVTRLAEQKGLDIVAKSMKEIVSLGAYFILLGTGSESYNNLFKKIAKKYKGKVGIKIAFDNKLAHKIEAGIDMFLMPSRYEPCGLNQMYSLKYATIPVVRATGGLNDTIEDFDPSTKAGNGFRFKKASKDALCKAIRKALKVYKNEKVWARLQKNALRCDFSWKASAREYAKLYKKMRGGE